MEARRAARLGLLETCSWNTLPERSGGVTSGASTQQVRDQIVEVSGRPNSRDFRYDWKKLLEKICFSVRNLRAKSGIAEELQHDGKLRSPAPASELPQQPAPPLQVCDCGLSWMGHIS